MFSIVASKQLPCDLIVRLQSSNPLEQGLFIRTDGINSEKIQKSCSSRDCKVHNSTIKFCGEPGIIAKGEKIADLIVKPTLIKPSLFCHDVEKHPMKAEARIDVVGAGNPKCADRISLNGSPIGAVTEVFHTVTNGSEVVFAHCADNLLSVFRPSTGVYLEIPLKCFSRSNIGFFLGAGGYLYVTQVSTIVRPRECSEGPGGSIVSSGFEHQRVAHNTFICNLNLSDDGVEVAEAPALATPIHTIGEHLYLSNGNLVGPDGIYASVTPGAGEVVAADGTVYNFNIPESYHVYDAYFKCHCTW